MGFFDRKEKKSEEGIPTLPRLPKLPELPDMEEENSRGLPSFVSNSSGKKFSNNSIKDAVSGESGDEDFYADDFPDDRGMMQESLPLAKPRTEEVDEGIQRRFPEKKEKMRESFRQEAESVFVRIDKFEDGLKIFENIKDRISEIEKILADTKRLKEKEEAELNSWESELKRMEAEIEKIGKDIFSKI